MKFYGINKNTAQDNSHLCQRHLLQTIARLRLPPNHAESGPKLVANGPREIHDAALLEAQGFGPLGPDLHALEVIPFRKKERKITYFIL